MPISKHETEVAGWEPSRRLKYERSLLRLLVAARIENLLDGLNLKQVDLAKRIGKSSAWVSKLLSGKQNLTLDTLAEIGWALGVRWDPRACPAPRENTPAASDWSLPDWVHGQGEIAIRHVEATGHAMAWIDPVPEAHYSPVYGSGFPWIVDYGLPLAVGDSTAQAAIVNCVAPVFSGTIVWTAAEREPKTKFEPSFSRGNAAISYEGASEVSNANRESTFDVRTEVTT